MSGVYAYVYTVTEGDCTLYVVAQYEHNVSDVFNTLAEAEAFFLHTERYEAALEARTSKKFRFSR